MEHVTGFEPVNRGFAVLSLRPLGHTCHIKRLCFKWWTRLESNQHSFAYEATALTVRPRVHPVWWRIVESNHFFLFVREMYSRYTNPPCMG